MQLKILNFISISPLSYSFSLSIKYSKKLQILQIKVVTSRKYKALVKYCTHLKLKLNVLFLWIYFVLSTFIFEKKPIKQVWILLFNTHNLTFSLLDNTFQQVKVYTNLESLSESYFQSSRFIFTPKKRAHTNNKCAGLYFLIIYLRC